MPLSQKTTIAVMSGVINWWYGKEIIKGIRSLAIERGINLRFFCGGHIDAPQIVEQERNAVYRMINEENSDGIIAISAGLLGYLSKEQVTDYFSFYKNLPVVGIGDFPAAIPHVLVDNQKGMRQLIRHLIADHGYRKIAFISGPVSNEEAVIRLNIYKEVLTEYGIPVDPDYIVYGTFNWACSEKLITELLDRRKLDIDAIACANDDMAFGAYYALVDRGYKIPHDIGLTGFDDVHEPRYIITAFTTARQPYYEQGRKALEMVLEAARSPAGTVKPLKTAYLPAEMVIRKSCGCGQPISSWDYQNTAATPDPGKNKGQKKFNKVLIENLGSFYSHSSDTKKNNIRSLYLTLVNDLTDRQNSTFCVHLKNILSHPGISNDEISKWNRILALFCNHITGGENDPFVLKRLLHLVTEAEDILDETRTIIMANSQGRYHLREMANKQTVEAINSCHSFDDLLEAVRGNFPRTGMDCFYLSCYSKKMWGFPPSAMPIEKAHLMLGYDGKDIARYRDEKSFPINHLIPGGIFKFKKHNHFVVCPVTINNQYFGIIAMEYDEEKTQIYEPLVERLCTIIGTIQQFTEIEQTVKMRTQELKELDIAKNNFVANISHELRTPLTLILGPLESLMAGNFGKSVQSDHSSLQSMHTNSVRLLKLINTLLDYSKIEAGKMRLNKQNTNINKLLHYYVSSVHTGIGSKGLSITFRDWGEKIIIPVDRGLFEKAFFNLISNAMKFSSRGGTIAVELSRDGHDILISVKDQGIGIPHDKLEAVFDRFTQVDQGSSRTYEGTGIGLAFTREIIQLHQGSVSVASEQGKGSEFTIRLPFPGEQIDKIDGETGDFNEIKSWLTEEFTVEQKKQISGKTVQNKSSECILIVDDNSSMRDFISSLLEKKYPIGTAENGKDALRKIETHLPDLIISDVMMPEMDGIELCTHLKKNKKTAHIPLILLTARADISTRIAGLEQKADDYLFKPFNARELFARIENLLEKRRLELSLEATTASLWSEMETARQIQASLLPGKPVIDGFDIACYIKSASEVGGDYYDIIQKGQNTWLIIGDVSGHGVTAGLVMMMVQTAIMTLLENTPDISPSRLLSGINRVIKNNIKKLNQEKFMTIIAFSIVDNRRFIFSGLHQDLYIYRAEKGTVEIIESKGMWIGFIDDISHLVQNDSFELNKGDTILLYTDGITEAVKKNEPAGKSRQRFGNEKLLDLFYKNGRKSPEEIKALLIDELENYECDDDFTFVIIRSS